MALDGERAPVRRSAEATDPDRLAVGCRPRRRQDEPLSVKLPGERVDGDGVGGGPRRRGWLLPRWGRRRRASLCATLAAARLSLSAGWGSGRPLASPPGAGSLTAGDRARRGAGRRSGRGSRGVDASSRRLDERVPPTGQPQRKVSRSRAPPPAGSDEPLTRAGRSLRSARRRARPRPAAGAPGGGVGLAWGWRGVGEVCSRRPREWAGRLAGCEIFRGAGG